MVEDSRSGVELLVRSGISRTGARVLVLIAMRGRILSVDIEDALGIGQSGVSAAIRELSAHGWVRAETIPTQSKGRPRHAYVLSKPFSKIVDEVEGVGEREIGYIRQGVLELRHIASVAECQNQ